VVMNHGAGAVRVEAPCGKRLVVPLEWTNLHPRAAPLEHQGQIVRLDPAGLATLASWVAARKLDSTTNNEKVFASSAKMGENAGDDKLQTTGDASTYTLVGQAGPTSPCGGGDGAQGVER